MSYDGPWFKGGNLITGPTPTSSIFIKSFDAKLWVDKFTESGISAMEEHHNMVWRLAPTERLPEYDMKQSWGPLCEFLGKNLPATDFPRLNHLQAHKVW
jgi:hypothetical protein